MDHDEGDRRASEREGVAGRQLGREHCLLNGFLLRPGALHVEEVGLVNLSLSGAMMTIEGLGVLPAGTVLLIPRIEAAYEIEVIWRELPQLGVRFTRSVPTESDASLRAVLRAAAA